MMTTCMYSKYYKNLQFGRHGLAVFLYSAAKILAKETVKFKYVKYHGSRKKWEEESKRLICLQL